MQPQQFEAILNSLPLLTTQQRNDLIEALSENDSPVGVGIAATIEANFSKTPKCPRCCSEVTAHFL